MRDRTLAMGSKRLLLIDTNDARRRARADSLRATGYRVQEVVEGAAGAEEALLSPPGVIVAELWMPTVSGLQLCRLMKSEPSTCDVPVVLCGDDDPKNRFWAKRAGAYAYVSGGPSELLQAVNDATAMHHEDEAFFTQLPDGSLGIRDRIARQLDEALFDAVIASEVRALANAGSFEQLFEGLAELMSQITRYRFLALSIGGRLFLHHHPRNGVASSDEARRILRVDVTALELADARASDSTSAAPISFDVLFGQTVVASFAIAPANEADAATLARIVARELGGPVKIASLIEESRRVAATDALTGLPNRRAFSTWITTEMARFQRYGTPLSLVVVDVDHFKRVNDELGHPAGDHVLATVSNVLREHVRESDIVARWGGEEFIVAYTSTDVEGAAIAAERLRVAIEAADIRHQGERISVTVSLGLAGAQPRESAESLVNRADHAMYASKRSGRNRLTLAQCQPFSSINPLTTAVA